MHINSHLLFAAIILAFFALILFVIARILYRHTGIPEGRIISVDHGLWQRNKKPLYDSGISLTGKPDYLLRIGEQVIPAEVKSSYAPRSPYDSHMMQLAAYCVLIERAFGERPPYGLLRYRTRTFKVKFTRALEDEVLEMVGTIRSHKNKDEVNRSHNYPTRCAACGYRNSCGQRL